MNNFSENNQNPRIIRYNYLENSTKNTRPGLKSCKYENKEQERRVVDVMMTQEKRMYILMCVSKRNLKNSNS